MHKSVNCIPAKKYSFEKASGSLKTDDEAIGRNCKINQKEEKKIRQ